MVTTTLRRLAKELQKLQSNPPEGIQVQINEEQLTEIHATILGPKDTPYEDGHFKIRLTIDNSFPDTPPTGIFLTKIFHPNVSEHGEICVNTLKKDWQKHYGIEHVLVTVKCLLIYPNPESALNEEAGKLLLERYVDYARLARLMTQIHAKPKSAELPQGNENQDPALACSEVSSNKQVSVATAKDKQRKKNLKRF
ncbi:ubiquitin-conjugating enzyme E2 S [Coemansia brasiliensis]|uniref:E2 ubiquitin-conjugating enzyme n=1 Tax=Coemansia brasiliensis TaxID=2650707 RepID=A0A9W8I3L1_9FUNG|nr:ubiquitin-conjugating enzyme E2 S [Coemansia brasiliensis]